MRADPEASFIAVSVIRRRLRPLQQSVNHSRPLFTRGKHAPQARGAGGGVRTRWTVGSSSLRAVPSRHPLLVALEPVAEALGATLVPASRVRGGDIPLEWDGELVGGLRLPGVHGALDRMIAAVESELGAPLAGLSREDKQRAVKLLDDRGAFQLRKAVEDVADALGVSRFTVYNYLNADVADPDPEADTP